MITLVIIGVIAAITVPTLIAKYRNEQTVTRLKKAFSEISQALRLAEMDYGSITTWRPLENFPSGVEATVDFAENYLFKHLNLMKKCIPASEECFTLTLTYDSGSNALWDKHVSAIATSGYSMATWVDGTGGWVIVDIDGPNKGPNQLNRDIFNIKFVYKDKAPYDPGYITRAGVYLDGGQYEPRFSREELINRKYCGFLMQIDSWQIKPDNPCF